MQNKSESQNSKGEESKVVGGDIDMFSANINEEIKEGQSANII